MIDVNNPTGHTGLVAIDKRGCMALFFDPTTYQELARVELPPRPHELALSADHRTTFVSVYGSGIYGNNPKPGNTIVVLDLASRTRVDTLDVSPYLAPHGLALDGIGNAVRQLRPERVGCRRRSGPAARGVCNRRAQRWKSPDHAAPGWQQALLGE